MVFDDTRVFGLTAFPKIRGNMKYSWGRPAKEDHKLWSKAGTGKNAKQAWQIAVPLRPRAMVLAGDKVFIAGPPDVWPQKGGQVRCYKAADGTELGTVELDAPPVFDGMAAANQRLYISTQDGKLRCLGKK